MSQRFYIETLGCPKNQVDSDKLIGTLLADGMTVTDDPGAADLVVVNTCAFIEEARQESIDTILASTSQRRKGGAARRHGLHGRALRRTSSPRRCPRSTRSPVSASGSTAPCRARATGRQADPRRLGRAARARPAQPAAAEVVCAVGVRQDRRGLRPLVRVLRHPVVPRPAAQPRPSSRSSRGRRARGAARSCSSPRTSPRTARTVRASSGRADRAARRGGRRARRAGPAAVPLPERPHRRAGRRDLRDRRARTSTSRCSTSASRCCGGCAAGATATASSQRIARHPRAREPDAAFRSNFIVGYPGETEADHDLLLRFVEEAQLDWCGFFAYSPRGRHATRRRSTARSTAALMNERLAELRELQDDITARAARRADRRDVESSSTHPASAARHREAPEIDGIVHVRP